MTISNREVIDEFKQSQAQAVSGQQLGGGPGAADRDAAGGSSGSGGYGGAMDQSADQGADGGAARPVPRELSRGERYDMEQGGGRADDVVDFGDERKQDERERAEAGQRFLDDAGDLDGGAFFEGQQP